MIMAAMLLVSTVSVFAADVKSEGKKEQKKIEIKAEKDVSFLCSISLQATVGPSFAQVSVTCTGTAVACKEAVSIAKNCLDEARKAFM
jgi:hypothetical protein